MFCTTVIQRKGSSYISIVSVIQRSGSIVGNVFNAKNYLCKHFVVIFVVISLD